MAHIPPRSRGTLRAQADTSYAARTILLPVQKYIHTESIGGLALLVATAIALALANSPWAADYHHVLESRIAIDSEWFHLDLSVEQWVNDGLMAIFFFVVGLEIKRELIHGQLSTPRRAAMPAIAAVGGMVVPALIYLAINIGGEGARGWGIPMATDIAFALGALALLGRRIPIELRVFLLGLAVVDDLGAIAVIAVAYTESIDLGQLWLAASFAIGMIVANRLGFRNPVLHAALALMIWFTVHESGVHATVAGVVIAMLIPSRPSVSSVDFSWEAEALLAEYHTARVAGQRGRAESIIGEIESLTMETEAPLERMERLLHPWTSYVILPIFAFANAGVELSPESARQAAESGVAIGVFAGLVVGKVVGIVLFPYVASRLGLASLPPSVEWRHVVGVGLVAGIGFTVAIFVSGLAFDDPELADAAKMGILVASLVAGLGGYGLLRLFTMRTARF